MKNGKWDARIRRAEELASSYPFAAEGLRFYHRVVEFQKSLYAQMEKACGTKNEKLPGGSLRDKLDFAIILPHFASFLSVIEKNAPAPLSHCAYELRSRGPQRWQELLSHSWNSERDRGPDLSPAEAVIFWVFLQPCAEYLADHSEPLRLDSTPLLCPACGRRPLVGVLRPEGDGARRSLVCSLCSTEWNFHRIGCPACGEADEKKLAVYTSEQFSHLRVEACVTCRHYIKTVDLTKNGHAVPVVDEMAAIPLDLWAAENGYAKLQPNLLGL